MLNIFVNFRSFLTKLLGIDPYKNQIQGGLGWDSTYMVAKLSSKWPFYKEKTACVNDNLPSVHSAVYLLSMAEDCTLLTFDCSFSRLNNKTCKIFIFSLLFSGALQDDWSFLWFNIVPEGVQWSFACVLFLSGEFPIFSLVF